MNEYGLEKTSLYDDLVSIATKQTITSYKLRVEIYYENTVLDIFRVTTMHTYSNYELRYAEDIGIDVAMNAGVYNVHVVPNNDRLFANLYIEKYVSGQPVDITKRTMRAYFRELGDDKITQNKAADLNQAAVGNMVLATYSVTLIDQAIEQLRTMPTGGIFPTSKPSSVIKVVLGGISQGLELSEEYRPKDIKMWDPDIDDVKEHVIVKQGIDLCDLPGYIQKFYGIYNTGIAYFYHNLYWYVWPLYNTMRFNQAEDTMVVVQVPRDKFPAVETTYELRGSSLAVLATGDSKLMDLSTQNQMSAGNGTRVATASGVAGSTGMVVDKGTAIVSRGENNIEVVTTEQRSGINYAPTSNVVTDNVANVISQTAHRNGSRFQFTWENSDPELLKPGMPVKFLYLKNGVVAQRYGVVLVAESSYYLINPGLTDTWMRCNTAVTLFIDDTDDNADNPTVVA